MPLDNGLVGATQLPVPAGAIGDALADPLVDALLDFSAYYIKWALDAKLANITGTSSDAVPTANRFTFDPLEARGHQIKLPHPALFVYWDGRSVYEQQTVLYWVRKREIHFLYVFDELPFLEEMRLRAGLFNAVDAAMHRMSVHQVHLDYGYGTDPSGTWINSSVEARDYISWEWRGSTPGRFGIDEGPRAERRMAKRSGRDWPALKGSWEAMERTTLRTMQEPDDLAGDIVATIMGSDGETLETVEIMQRVLEAPDGTEEFED